MKRSTTGKHNHQCRCPQDGELQEDKGMESPPLSVQAPHGTVCRRQQRSAEEEDGGHEGGPAAPAAPQEPAGRSPRPPPPAPLPALTPPRCLQRIIALSLG